MGLSDGDILYLTQTVAVPKQLLIVLARAMVDGQELLILVTNVTLKVPQLLVQGTVLLGHMPDLLLKGFDLPCISTKVTPLSCNDVLGVILQLEEVLSISRLVRPTTMIVVLKGVAHLINVCLPLWIRVVLDWVQRDRRVRDVR
jgi:hypothetical protein